MDEFNFLNKKVFVELVNGTKLDGILVYMDDKIVCLRETTVAGINRKIIYREKVTYISNYENTVKPADVY